MPSFDTVDNKLGALWVPSMLVWDATSMTILGVLQACSPPYLLFSLRDKTRILFRMRKVLSCVPISSSSTPPSPRTLTPTLVLTHNTKPLSTFAPSAGPPPPPYTSICQSYPHALAGATTLLSSSAAQV
ncbi:hypothetical protein PMIN07_007705 [Paraphaeosphaeria minitans]